MAGSALKLRHRKLSRDSAHRQSLLRNLVTSLIKYESIRTTWPKAKEAQRMAEKLITLGKRNTNAARNKATSIFWTPHQMLPKLFGPLRERYANRPGGYTRVLRTEPKSTDQAETAILELVDGERDMRLMMTAQTLARDRMLGRESTASTKGWVQKVTRYRGTGSAAPGDVLSQSQVEGFEKEAGPGAVGVPLQGVAPQKTSGSGNTLNHPDIAPDAVSPAGQAKLEDMVQMFMRMEVEGTSGTLVSEEDEKRGGNREAGVGKKVEYKPNRPQSFYPNVHGVLGDNRMGLGRRPAAGKKGY